MIWLGWRSWKQFLGVHTTEPKPLIWSVSYGGGTEQGTNASSNRVFRKIAASVWVRWFFWWIAKMNFKSVGEVRIVILIAPVWHHIIKDRVKSLLLTPPRTTLTPNILPLLTKKRFWRPRTWIKRPTNFCTILTNIWLPNHSFDFICIKWIIPVFAICFKQKNSRKFVIFFG